ncbi:MAG: hypothetical protein ACUBOA_02345 [Candidatus Loosdrechtia sp.]|uniref:hypothetical protein n=1 Tax=Candidatus Loosdrechtia sp. TaxID=3101272 RepID=UPI003A6669AA|nr:MAG: hypothetical protein QY305_08280 [Candidatus Jettenia sp. AMX2]
MEKRKLPVYEIPSIVTYTDEEILEGLVQHCPAKQDRVKAEQKISREALILSYL